MQINRLIFPGFWFDKNTWQQGEELARAGVGGFCLYGGTGAQIKEFCARVRRASPWEKILICADYEDGLGRWVKDSVRLAPNMALGAADSTELSFEKGFLTALAARALGVDWVFAPVADLADTPDNPIVNTRAFSAHPQAVIRLAGALMKGLTQGGALNCLKHFPGHGQTRVDSHLALPVLSRTPEELFQAELKPFAALLPLADGVMTGHLKVPALDAREPASLSAAITTGLLKEKLGWKGCVLTDALLMRAIGDECHAAREALNAGAHILLAMNDPHKVSRFLHIKNSPAPALLRAAHAQLDALCARSNRATPVVPPTHAELEDFNRRTARAACVWNGAFRLQAGERVRAVVLGDDEQTGWAVLREKLTQSGIQLTDGPADKVLIISLANYKSFKGRIRLTPQDESRALQAARQTRQSALVCLGSPFAALPLKGAVSAVLQAFCPLPAFQYEAAALLLGHHAAQGKMPVCV